MNTCLCFYNNNRREQTLETINSMQVNAGSIAPITAVQFGANKFYEVTLKSITGKDSGQAGQVAVAIAAGSTSSLISTPAELLMIQQGRNQRALMTEARSYISRHGLTALYRGFVSLLTILYQPYCLLVCVPSPSQESRSHHLLRSRQG